MIGILHRVHKNMICCRQPLEYAEWKKMVQAEGESFERQYQRYYVDELTRLKEQSEMYEKEIRAKEEDELRLIKKHPLLSLIKKVGLGAAGVMITTLGAVTAPIWLPPLVVYKVIDG